MLEIMTWENVSQIIIGIFSVLAMLIATIWAVCQIIDRSRLRNNARLKNLLATHCPREHKPILQLIEKVQLEGQQTRRELGHELGLLKNVIIQNSPNGSLKRISDRLDGIEQRLPDPKKAKRDAKK